MSRVIELSRKLNITPEQLEVAHGIRAIPSSFRIIALALPPASFASPEKRGLIAEIYLYYLLKSIYIITSLLLKFIYIITFLLLKAIYIITFLLLKSIYIITFLSLKAIYIITFLLLKAIYIITFLLLKAIYSLTLSYLFLHFFLIFRRKLAL